jgi:hypothetical protein
MSIETLLNRFFRREEINGGNRCPTYLYRWTLFQPTVAWLKGLGVYLHHFVGDDWSFDLHDHPKRFVSIGLRGQYLEETPGACSHIYRAPWIRTFPAEHRHRISMIEGRDCWTLVIVFPASRPWGFWHLGQWIHWKQYVTETGGPADKMKSCPE